MSGDNDRTATWSNLNNEAFLALSGARADVASALANLIRSDAPIDPIVRAALADALEGRRPAACPLLTVTKVGRGHETASGLARFRLHVALAEEVEARIANGEKRASAEQGAACDFMVGEDLCHKAVTGYRKMRKWLAEHGAGRPAGYPENLWLRTEQASYLFSVGPLVRGPSNG